MNKTIIIYLTKINMIKSIIRMLNYIKICFLPQIKKVLIKLSGHNSKRKHGKNRILINLKSMISIKMLDVKVKNMLI